MQHTYRNDIPGMPNLYTGEGYKDPLAVTEENVRKHLVGWMTVYQLATSLGITTEAGSRHLREFLRSSNFNATYDHGEELWSNFHGPKSSAQS